MIINKRPTCRHVRSSLLARLPDADAQAEIQHHALGKSAVEWVSEFAELLKNEKDGFTRDKFAAYCIRFSVMVGDLEGLNYLLQHGTPESEAESEAVLMIAQITPLCARISKINSTLWEEFVSLRATPTIPSILEATFRYLPEDKELYSRMEAFRYTWEPIWDEASPTIKSREFFTLVPFVNLFFKQFTNLHASALQFALQNTKTETL